MSVAAVIKPPTGITIRRMRGDELAIARTWAAREGWNPGAHDMEAFQAIDPDGFWIALHDDEPAACISILAYDAAYAFLGHYIAAPDYRGRGIGWALWRTAMAACPSRAIGLDGVLDQQANYARSGFVFRHRNVRHEGTVGPSGASPVGIALRPIGSGDHERIAFYDRSVFGRDRSRFLGAWLVAPGHRTMLAERGGETVGYGVARPCERGTKVGPLFARNADVADALLRALCDGMPAPHVLDVPEPNAPGMALAAAHGLVPAFETARMVRGPAPPDDTARTFGVTTFEAG